MSETPFALVLSGGGLKGLAHVGVLKALEERGMSPSLVVGTSMGALIAAAWSVGRPIPYMVDRAHGIARRDVFRVAHLDMAFRRMHAPAVYRPEPLDELIADLVGDAFFDDLQRPLLVNTVDIESGMQVLWGSPGLRDVQVAEAVYASCALPGIFPPREIRGRYFCDGALVTNLPVRAAVAFGHLPVIAVDVGATHRPGSGRLEGGFAATYVRGIEIVMQNMLESATRHWLGQPVLLVNPRVNHLPMFAFAHARELVAEGYRATREALALHSDVLSSAEPGIYPRHMVEVSVNESRCVGCGACVMRAPHIFRVNDQGKAEVVHPLQSWSPLDGDYLRNCPTDAISARRTEQ